MVADLLLRGTIFWLLQPGKAVANVKKVENLFSVDDIQPT